MSVRDNRRKERGECLSRSAKYDLCPKPVACAHRQNSDACDFFPFPFLISITTTRFRWTRSLSVAFSPTILYILVIRVSWKKCHCVQFDVYCSLLSPTSVPVWKEQNLCQVFWLREKKKNVRLQFSSLLARLNFSIIGISERVNQ